MQKYLSHNLQLQKNSLLGERRAAGGVSTRPDEHIHQLYL